MSLYDPQKRHQKRIVKTEDGTITLYSSEFDECYHSTRDGALNESLNKHIIPAFKLIDTQKDELNILDVCFGLGYNTLTTLYYLQNNPIESKINIFSPEFDEDLVASLQKFDYPKEFEPFSKIIEQISKEGFYSDESISIKILFGDARESIPKIESKIDILYQDPFSPKKNPLLWTKEYFATIKAIASKDLILTTYSSATAVRMGLYENGFLLYETPSQNVRTGTITSLRPLNLKSIDMELKKSRNPQAHSLRDEMFLNRI